MYSVPCLDYIRNRQVELTSIIANFTWGCSSLMSCRETPNEIPNEIPRWETFCAEWWSHTSLISQLDKADQKSLRDEECLIFGAAHVKTIAYRMQLRLGDWHALRDTRHKSISVSLNTVSVCLASTLIIMKIFNQITTKSILFASSTLSQVS